MSNHHRRETREVAWDTIIELVTESKYLEGDALQDNLDQVIKLTYSLRKHYREIEVRVIKRRT